MNILDRFLKYVAIDTTSNPEKNNNPTSENQRQLANVLVKELNDLNIDVYYDEEHCYVYGKLRGNSSLPSIGFVSHLDTSPSASGKDIKPRIIENYDGNDIGLDNGDILSVEKYNDLKNHIGKTLIVTDGNTLLGADDKAGIAEIMDMLEYYVCSNDAHGDILVCFTPDEEVGIGIMNLDTKRFNPDFAYTVDGSDLGEFSYENFNAGSVSIKIKGVPSHLGYAKGILINALRVAIEFDGFVPKEYPENTEGKEGYYVLHDLHGGISDATLIYHIRDFDIRNFKKRKEVLLKITEHLNKKYGNIIEINFKDLYYNMYDIIKKEKNLIEGTLKAMTEIGITPKVVPIRGGTDGTEISTMGIPCPNLGAGGHNFHSVHEYVCLEDMENISEILKNIIRTFSKEIVRKREK